MCSPCASNLLSHVVYVATAELRIPRDTALSPGVYPNEEAKARVNNALVT